MPLTVAVIAGGGFQGQGIIEAIHALPDGRALVVDSTADAPGELLADRYVVAPLLDAPEFQDFLLDLVRTERVSLILPATQRELRCLADMTARLSEAGARVAACPGELLDILLDKQALYRSLDAAGLPVQALVELTASAAFPLFGRPRSGWGGRDVQVLHSLSGLRAVDVEALARSYAWVSWLPAFEEVSADFAIDFERHVSPLTLRRRVRTSGGFAVISESEQAPQVAVLVGRLAAWLASRGACGLFNVQLLRTPDGALLVSDVNPRHGTSSGHALGEGNNLVAFLLGRDGGASRRLVRTIRTLEQHALPRFAPDAIKGVVFDLDDTLLDHKQWIVDRMRLAASRLGAGVDATGLLEQTYLALEEGEHARLIDVVTTRLGVPALRDALLQAYRAAVPQAARIFPEVADVLAVLRARGLKLAILTDNPPASQQAKLDASEGLAQAFDAVVFSREHGAEKPAIEPFRAVAERLELPPESLLMVGDSVARDAFGAIRAGWLACVLVDRPGGRYRAHAGLMASLAADVAARTSIHPDLRVLPPMLRPAEQKGLS